MTSFARAAGYAAGVLWSLPHTIIGLLLCLVYIPHRVRWSEGCLEVIPRWIAFRPDAQTHGIVIFYSDAIARGNVGLRVHERTHVLQGFIFGPLYPVTYLAFFVALYAWQVVGGGGLGWVEPYRDIPWERWAYDTQSERRLGRRPGAWGSRP